MRAIAPHNRKDKKLDRDDRDNTASGCNSNHAIKALIVLT